MRRDRVVGEGDLAAQTTQVMQNLGLALKAAGAQLRRHCEDCNLRRRLQAGAFRAHHRPGAARPSSKSMTLASEHTRWCLSALAAPEWLIEIEAVAVVD